MLLLVQLGSSFELFVDLTLIVAIGLALALLGRRWRPALLRVSALVGLAYAACLPILVPIAVLALSGQHAPLRYSPANFSIDVFNVAIPTPTLLAGMFDPAGAVSEHFVSNVGEQNGYLGIPLLVVAALAVRAEWRRGAWLAGGLLVWFSDRLPRLGANYQAPEANRRSEDADGDMWRSLSQD